GSSAAGGDSRMRRGGELQRAGMAESHAREQSIAREWQNSTRGSSPSLKNRRIPRGGVFHRSEIAELHAVEQSTAQKSRNFLRWSSLLRIICANKRVGAFGF